MNEDFNNGPIAILLVLALVISVLSTFTILKAIEEFEYAPPRASEIGDNAPTTGSVMLDIVEPQTPETGVVVLSIKR